VNTGFQCPVCCKSVCTVYGLWFHVVKRHHNRPTSHFTLRCPVCRAAFKGLQKLDSHIHGSHLSTDPTADLSDDDEKTAGDAAKRLIAASKSMSPLASIGPLEMLMQLDFSCGKFGLVAQISAEHPACRRGTTSKTAVACPSCDRSFPCSAAVDLHARNVHVDAQQAMSCTACSLCFVSRDQRDLHMMSTHDASQVMVEFLRSTSVSDPRDGRITREEFLLVLGLKALPIGGNYSTEGDDDAVSPQPAVAKGSDVDANQNLLRTASTPAAVGVSASLTPLVVGPLMALRSPVATPIFPAAVPVPAVLPHSLSLVSSPAVSQSTIQLISSSGALALLNASSNSIQSISAMAGTFPFVSSFVASAPVERQSPGLASDAAKNCSRGSFAPIATVGSDTGSKLGSSDAEESNRTSAYSYYNNTHKYNFKTLRKQERRQVFQKTARLGTAHILRTVLESS